jgi:hypothetical protein
MVHEGRNKHKLSTNGQTELLITAASSVQPYRWIALAPENTSG